MKLRATLYNKRTEESFRITLCKFKNKYGEKTFIEPCVIHDTECIKVLVDEGYMKTTYNYPVNTYNIISLIVED